MYRWEIYTALVKYEDNPSTIEERPVLIIDKDYVYALKITSQKHLERKYDISIEYWKEAGLEKESYVSIDKKLEIPKKDFIKRIGKLDSIDIKNIAFEFNKMLKEINNN